MKTLVTGGGGFLGGALVRELVAAGRSVRSCSRGDYPELTRLGVEQVRGDLADAEVASAAIDGCDTVFHVAALAGAWGPAERFERTNVEATRHVLEGCRRAGVRHLIYTSTPSVVFDGGDMEGADESVPYAEDFEADYPRTKAIAEREVLAANGADLRTVALRPHLVWGPGDTNLLPRIVDRRRRGRLRQIGRRGKRIAPTYIDDAVSAHLAAESRLKHTEDADESPAGRAYFVTSGETIEVETLTEVPSRSPYSSYGSQATSTEESASSLKRLSPTLPAITPIALTRGSGPVPSRPATMPIAVMPPNEWPSAPTFEGSTRPSNASPAVLERSISLSMTNDTSGTRWSCGMSSLVSNAVFPVCSGDATMKPWLARNSIS